MYFEFAMSESPASEAQSASPQVNGVVGTINGLLQEPSSPQVNGVVGTINGVLQENMTKLQEDLVSTKTYTISEVTIWKVCLSTIAWF